MNLIISITINTSPYSRTKYIQVPHVEGWHTSFGEYSMMVMWLWILYRFKEDGAYLIGLKSHFEGGHGHGGHHDEEHIDIDAILDRAPGSSNSENTTWVKSIGSGRAKKTV